MRSPRAGPLLILAIAATTVVLAAGGEGAGQDVARSSASAWLGVAGGARPRVSVGQRMIVVLKTPSVAERVAAAGGRASDVDERRWTTSALSAQKLLISRLGVEGVQIVPEHSFARTIDAFSAPLDARALSLLERADDVAGVYPVRVAYPASVSARLIGHGLFAPGSVHRANVQLPGFDGRGVTIALLDTGIDRAQPFLRGRVREGIDVVGDDQGALAAEKPGDPSEVERHGTELAGLLVGAGGPSGLAGVATGASIQPIRVAGWQRDASGGVSVYARTDQVIAGLERAVDPNDDGDAHDAARIALVGLAAPFDGFPDDPAAVAAAGALALDTLVVAAAGNDGAAGPGYGSISGPGASPAALTVGAADLRRTGRAARVSLRAGLDTVLNEILPLSGAVEPDRPLHLAVGAPAVSRARGGARVRLSDFFDGEGYSVVAGAAALVPAGENPGAAARAAVRAGAAAVLLYGRTVPAGSLGLDEDVSVPVLALPPGTGPFVLAALRRGQSAGVDVGVATRTVGLGGGGVAPFSSTGLAFDGRVKPDLVSTGVGLTTAEPGTNDDGSPRFGTVNGTSAAAATVAGAAALLAQARPALGAVALKSVLAGSARRLGGVPVTSQGAGMLDLGAAAAAELSAAPTTLALGHATGAGWVTTQTIALRSISTRALRVRVSVQRDAEGAASVRFRYRSRLIVRPGEDASIRLVARVSSAPVGTAPASGAVEIQIFGGRTVRIPWAITFGSVGAPLLSPVRLSQHAFRPSDSAPTLLAFQAGALLRSGGREAVQPLDRLDVELWNEKGERLGLLARVRDLLPGRYQFGLTGRDPAGEVLPPGIYRVRLVAYPTGHGERASEMVRFRIQSGAAG